MLGAFFVTASLPDQIRSELQRIAENKSAEYNCSVSIAAMTAEWSVPAAAGIVDFSTKRAAAVSDRYAWGSGTKPLTGASILKLISEGHFDLESRVAPLVDAATACARALGLTFRRLCASWTAGEGRASERVGDVGSGQ